MDTQAESIRTARLFEFYVHYIWPLHRKLVQRHIARRCRGCAASEKMISLDSGGLCELCRKLDSCVQLKHASKSPTKETSLNEILQQYQGKGAFQYDAICLFSGGKDSTYMIHRLRSEFPRLRMLACTIDNGFMSPVAKDNVYELIGKLEVDHIFVRPEKAFYKKLFRYCLTHLNENGGYFTLDFSDGEFMLDIARTLAAEKRIPLILCGYSLYQVQNGLHLHDFESPRARELTDRKDTAGLLLTDIFSNENDVQRWWHGQSWPPERVARLLFPLYAWDLEESQIKQKVTEWNLLSAKEYSPIVTNHQLIPLIGVVDVHRFGYSSFEVEFCRMIREGKADRKEWQHTFEFLEYASKTGLFVRKIVVELLKELDLTAEDVGVKFT